MRFYSPHLTFLWSNNSIYFSNFLPIFFTLFTLINYCALDAPIKTFHHISCETARATLKMLKIISFAITYRISYISRIFTWLSDDGRMKILRNFCMSSSSVRRLLGHNQYFLNTHIHKKSWRKHYLYFIASHTKVKRSWRWRETTERIYNNLFIKVLIFILTQKNYHEEL